MALDPEGAARVLELDPDGGLDSMLKIKELIEEGALIAILGDRLPPNSAAERVVRAPFLGAEAAFPAGPFLLAATLKCPVYLTFGLSRDPDTTSTASPSPSASPSRAATAKARWPSTCGGTPSASSTTCARPRTTGSTSTTSGRERRRARRHRREVSVPSSVAW